MFKLKLFCCMLILPSAAFAYIDSGTGAYVVQTLITMVGVAIFFVTHPRELARAVLNRIRNLFKKNKEQI